MSTLEVKELLERGFGSNHPDLDQDLDLDPDPDLDLDPDQDLDPDPDQDPDQDHFCFADLISHLLQYSETLNIPSLHIPIIR